MTATIDPNGKTDTTPEVPAWLNLDEIISPEERGDIADALAATKAMLPDILDVADMIRHHVADLSTATRSLPNDAFEVVNEITGVADLYSIGSALEEIFEAAVDGKVVDEAVTHDLNRIRGVISQEVQS